MACNARRTGGGILEGSGGVRNILAGDVSLGKEESADDSFSRLTDPCKRCRRQSVARIPPPVRRALHANHLSLPLE